MANPRSLVYALYSHWAVVEWLVQCSRETPAFEPVQVLALIGKCEPALSPDEREASLRSLLSSGVLQSLTGDELVQLNPYVQEFVRGLCREHELGLSAVLQARVQGIRSATAHLKEAIELGRQDQLRQASVQLLELFRQISLQLEQDRHAIMELAEKTRASDALIPAAQRYRQVLQAYDEYVEPMAAMMDSGADGSFYPLLEDATRALEHAQEWLLAQGALYTLRQQVSLAALQARLLCRQGREVLKQCSDTLLPLREEMRRHNRLSSSISQLLGQVRKRGLARTFRAGDLPLWRAERPRRISVGDEVRSIMAEARDFEPVSLSFPDEAPAVAAEALQLVDGAALRAQLKASIPLSSLLDWLHQQHPQLHDATLLRLYHELINEPEWGFQQADESRKTELHQVRVIHYPHGVFEQ